MDPADRLDFEFDIRKINFTEEGARMMYGIQRYYLNQDVPLVDSGIRGILQLNQFDYLHDIRFALKVNQTYSKDLKSLHTAILNPAKF